MIVSTDFNVDEQTLIISYYNEAGKISYIKKPVQQSDLFNWVLTQSPTEFRNWNNRFLRKAPSKYLSRFRLEELTQSRLSQADLDKIYAEHSPRKYFIDIEIKLIDNTFPDPTLAEREVNLITFVNDENIIFVMSTMDNFSQEQIFTLEKEVNEYLSSCGQTFTVKYLYFETEVEMLTSFYHRVLPNIPFLTGWNVIDFDWIYLINRAKRVNLDPMAAMPNSKLIGKSKLPIHMGLLDYLEVFMNTKPYKVVENYKLDYVADLVLGITKLKHKEYSSMLEAQRDTFNFVKYNVIDTCLPKLIDDKLGLLEVAFAISKFAKIEVSKVFSAVFITETLMCREFLERGRYLENDKRELGEEKTYDGAYVMKPEPGYYKYVMLRDFNSMYPNLTIQFNMSPDAYLGKVNSDSVISDDVIYTKNDTIFTNAFDSAARVILTRLYSGRVETKAEMARLEEQKEHERVNK